MTNERDMFLDCGAPSLYNKFIRAAGANAGVMGATLKDRKDEDQTFLSSDEYFEYRQDYMDFVKEYGEQFHTCSVLDEINSGEGTYRNVQMFKEAGLNVMPVWHFGSSEKWLEKYLEDGHDYIAIGGLVPNPVTVVRPALDRLWARYLTDKDGKPIVRVHGFAVTSFRLMRRYPWYSVDSTSWVKLAIYGKILIPRQCAEPFAQQPLLVSATDGRKGQSDHADALSAREQDWVEQYLVSIGITGGLEEACVDWTARLDINEQYYDGFETWKSTPEREIFIKPKKGFNL